MFERITSFLLTLGVIGWQVFDIVKGQATVLTWIALVFFSLCGLFELGIVFEDRKIKAAGEDQPAVQVA